MDPFLLILAAVTAFIIFRLISVMGTRSGHEQRHDLEQFRRSAASGDNGADNTDQPAALPERAPKPVSTNARVLRDADPDFDEAEFLAGARAAYEMIVEAFAAGDLRSIRPYLSEAVYESFKEAVAAREKEGLQTDLKFVGIDHASIVNSEVDDEWLLAVTDFKSNQVRVTRDKDQEIVDGDPNRIDLVKDRWTFSRRRDDPDPNWILVATGGAA